ncbi:NAD(P)H-dependent flavin oxidoreductase [Shewanella dokdonensis]|uniref:NAD(P)H-dependent flavin oxidoreductase n=1 Tax=Shewanella dokdonensis TaxID=712036 RepID=UPI00200D323B|nr:nitronate monooxygenase [Shewanella dokdonensis]MCL1075897.1 nitronate monooxygenase [Shewanella dokdonensis]
MQLFDVKWPLVQAPMAGAQGIELALAVASAGALGSLPCAMLNATQIQQAVAQFRQQTQAPINLNFFCHTPPEAQPHKLQQWQQRLQPYYQELSATPVDTVVERRPFDAAMAAAIAPLRPEVVSFHFGLPEPSLLQQVKSWGSKVIASATTVAEGVWLQAQGVDAVIAQGLEAGGHRGHFLTDELSLQSGTFALLPQLAAALNVPVIAAGGMVDATTIASAMKLGAAAVQVGTAYLLCPETTISQLHRQALVDPQRNQHTALTRVFSGRPARGIVNRLMREQAMADIPDFPLAASAIAPLRKAAEQQGNSDFSPLWCGQNASGCRAIPAAELTRQLVAGLPR